jgi:hypothetical protein
MRGEKMARDDLKKMFLSELEPLLKIYSPTGREKEVMLPFLVSKLEKQGFAITTDPSGMLIASRNGVNSVNIPSLCAHYDTVNNLRDDPEFRTHVSVKNLLKTVHPDFISYEDGRVKSATRLNEILANPLNSLDDNSEYLWAPNQHLGLDCKVGIAMIFTLIKNYDENKPLSILFTAGEEKGVFRKSVDEENGYNLSTDFISHLQRMSYCILLDRQGRKDMIKKYKDRDLLNDDQINAWSQILNMTPVNSPNMSDAYGLAGLGITCANISNGVYGEHDYEDFLALDYAVEIMQNALKWLNTDSSDLGIR